MYGRVATHEDGGEVSLKHRHSCTDCLCCVVFLAALTAFGGLFAFAVEQTGGSISRLFHGIDSQGRVCGVDGDVLHKPLLFWCIGGVQPSVSGDLASALEHGRRVCVSQCPGGGADTVQECTAAPARRVAVDSDDDPNASAADAGDALGSGGAAGAKPDGYVTALLLSKYCVPDLKQYGSAAQEVLSSQLGGSDERVAELITSIPSAWPAMLGAVVLAVALGYMHLCLVGCCAEVLLWMCILLTIAGFAALGGVLWLGASSEVLAARALPGAGRLLAAANGTIANSTAAGASLEETTADEERLYRVAAIVCWCLSALAMCLACFLRSSIDAAAACMEVACEAIFEMPTLLFAPIVKTVVKTVLFIGLLYGFLLLWAIGDATSFSVPLTAAVAEGDMDAPHISHSTKQKLAFAFYSLVAFWILAFVTALYEFVVAYAVATYYYTPLEEDDHGNFVDEKDVEGCCAALEGLRIGLVYHTGSFAFGSLAIALLHVLQKLIEYAQLKNEEAGENKVVACVLCICGCCVRCLADWVGFINRNAYIDMAIHSNSFCTAARSALSMVVELGEAMAILNGATYIFAVFGTLFITVACAAGTYVAVGFWPFADPSSMFFVQDPLAAAVLAVLVALPISLAFMDVFDMASDTLLYCYGVDLHAGKDDHHAPLALRDLLTRYGHDTGHDTGHGEHG